MPTSTRSGGWRCLVWAFASLACHPPPIEIPTIVDQVGHQVPVSASGRVVTLGPDVTEMVWALGSGPRVVAVPDTADYPAEARTRAQVNPGDLESILAHRPDLVVATTAGNDPRIVERLRGLGVPVFTADVTSFAQLQGAVALLGETLGTPAAGKDLADHLGRQTERATVARPGHRPGALFVIWWDPLIAAAPGSVHDDLLRRAGLENLAPAGTGRYPRLQPELLLNRRLQVIVTTDEPEVKTALAMVRRAPVGLRLRSNEVAVIAAPTDTISRPGPRLPEGLAFVTGAVAESRARTEGP